MRKEPPSVTMRMCTSQPSGKLARMITELERYSPCRTRVQPESRRSKFKSELLLLRDLTQRMLVDDQQQIVAATMPITRLIHSALPLA